MNKSLAASYRLVLPIVIAAMLAQPVFGQFSLVQTRTPAVRSAQDTTITPTQPEFILANQKSRVGLLPPRPPVLNDDDDTYDVPNPEILGADEPVKVGELIQLWVKQPEQQPEDLVSVKYSWTVLPTKEVVVWPDESRIIFGTGSVNTTHIVVMTASYVFAGTEPDGSISEIVQKTVTKIAAVQVTGGTGTSPPPVNPPGGDGGGDNVPNLSGLAKNAYRWVSSVNTSPSYDSVAVKADSAKLAVAFRSVADKIGNGEYTDVTTILRQTKAANDAAIENRNAWMPWFTQMSEYLQAAYADSTVKTPAQYQQAWLDIALGLDAASK